MSHCRGTPMLAAVRSQGFTLVELALTLAISAVSLVAIIYGWALTAEHSAEVTWQAKTAYVGQAYVEEVLTKRFDENSESDGSLPCGSGFFAGRAMPTCTPASGFGLLTASPVVSKDGEVREAFDDVDDYHGLNEEAMSLLRDVYSTTDNPYQNYRVAISVAYDTSFESTANMVKRISVSVTPPGQNAVVFTAYKGNY